MNTQTATSLARKFFLASVISTTGLLAGCSTCYHCQQDCPYGYDTSTGLYDKLVFGWMPDFMTLRSSGQSHGTAEHAHYHAAPDDYQIIDEAEAEVPSATVYGDALAPVPDLADPGR